MKSATGYLSPIAPKLADFRNYADVYVVGPVAESPAEAVEQVASIVEAAGEAGVKVVASVVLHPEGDTPAEVAAEAAEAVEAAVEHDGAVAVVVHLESEPEPEPEVTS